MTFLGTPEKRILKKKSENRFDSLRVGCKPQDETRINICLPGIIVFTLVGIFGYYFFHLLLGYFNKDVERKIFHLKVVEFLC